MFQAQDEAVLTSFEEALSQSAMSSSTITNYLADLRTFLRWGQHEFDSEFSLLDVNQEHIRLYRYHLVEKLNRATSTVNRHLMALKKFFTFANRLGIVSSNPLLGVALVQDDEQVMIQPLDEADVEKLLAAAQNGARASLARRDVAILTLLIYAGLRVSEIVNLRKEDLIFDHPGIRLRVCRPQDEEKCRHLTLPQIVYKKLSSYLAVRPQTAISNCLFLNQRGRPISERTVQRIVSDCGRAADLEGVSAQILRRTFAWQRFQATNDLELVSQELGHQTKAITAQYLLIQEPSGSRHGDLTSLV